MKEVVKISLEDKSLFDPYHPDPVAKQSSPHQKLGSLLIEENLDLQYHGYINCRNRL